MTINYSFASCDDIDNLIRFIDTYWKNNHILVRNRELFLYEFKEGNKINFALAKRGRSIVGIFGFLKYSNQDYPDIAGSIWKVLETESVPMLGIKLRNYVIKNIPHRAFVAPGAGIKTRNVYKLLKMNWHEMNHYFILNPNLSEYKICKLSKTYIPKTVINTDLTGIDIKLISCVSEIESFDFNKYKIFAPFKDLHYFVKRFIKYPEYNYDVFALFNGHRISSMCVCRSAEHLDRKVYRIVDYYGDESHISLFTKYLYNFIIQNNYEYIDFVCNGFDSNNLFNAGYSKLNFKENEIVIPNHFKPFIRDNIQIYANSDRIDGLKIRICKADGDQDRPN